MGTAFVAIGAVLALLGTLALFTGIVLLVGDQWLPADLYWVAALLVLRYHRRTRRVAREARHVAALAVRARAD